MKERLLKQTDIEAAEAVLKKGYCVEIRPIKDGVKLVKVIRQQISEKSNKVPSP